MRTGVLTPAIILACGLLASCDLERCVPAETVRVKLGETVYRLPASYRPNLFDTKLATQYVLRNGRNVQEYCQKPEDPAATAGAFSLGQKSLELIAAQRPEFSHLRGLDLIEVTYAPAGRPLAGNTSGSLVSNGLFRRVETNGTFEVYSTGPLLFGGQVSAFCGRAATQEPSNWCTIRGQITPGIPIRVKIVDKTHPIGEWPRTLEEVERLIKSFATP
jgi:hypothetical protein